MLLVFVGMELVITGMKMEINVEPVFGQLIEDKDVLVKGIMINLFRSAKNFRQSDGVKDVNHSQINLDF